MDDEHEEMFQHDIPTREDVEPLHQQHRVRQFDRTTPRNPEELMEYLMDSDSDAIAWDIVNRTTKPGSTISEDAYVTLVDNISTFIGARLARRMKLGLEARRPVVTVTIDFLDPNKNPLDK